VLHSPHTVEVPFVFGTAEAAAGLVGAGPDVAPLGRAVMARWSSFAHGGVPEAPGGVAWERYDPTGRAMMVLDVESRMARDPGGVSRAALDGLPWFEYSHPASYLHG
jgi:para-nitrobenzyl esterase